ncbi:MAG: hypothetical protein LCH61_05160 [Proteobacteria bacterium]|nr:hypothetical protein [Pseudomonadota bacterium]
MADFLYYVLVSTLTGLAFGGTLVATIGLITHQDLSFDLFFSGGRRAGLALPLLLLAGPVLLLRSLGPVEEGPALPLRIAIPGYLIATGWCLASGHALLRLSGLVAGLLPVSY